MQAITITTPPYASIETFDAVHAQLGTLPDGLQASYAGTVGTGGLRVIDVWESAAHAERYLTRTLGPALARVLGPEPGGSAEVIRVDVLRSHFRDP